VTGPECYQEALRLAQEALTYEGLPSNSHIQMGQVALVYATAALAAATALYDGDLGKGADTEYQAWKRIAGTVTS
jgi:hypothetical protein